MKSSLFPILVIVLVLLGGYFFLYKKIPVTQLTSTKPTVTPSVSIVPTPGSALPTKYIFPIDWPPKVSLENNPFVCMRSGSETPQAGQTQKMVISNHSYCVTKESEGATGSTYTKYAYARDKNGQTETYTFSLRFVQCDNYSGAEKMACNNERQTFHIDNFIDQYIQSNP